MNPGLMEISHSLTGGNLEAQGYWVPFEAAKAIAAKFAHPIRYLLTPIFGHDFPAICVDPNDPDYRDYKISPAIVQRCTEDARKLLVNSASVVANDPDVAKSGALPAHESSETVTAEGSSEPNSSATESPYPLPKKRAKKPLTTPKRAIKRAREVDMDSTASPSPSPETGISTLLPLTYASSSTSGVVPVEKRTPTSPSISPRSIPQHHSAPAPAPPSYASSPTQTGSPNPIGFTPAFGSPGTFWSGPSPSFNHPQGSSNIPVRAPRLIHHTHSFSEPIASYTVLDSAESDAVLSLVQMSQFPIHGIVEGVVPQSARLSRQIMSSSAAAAAAKRDAEGMSVTALVRMKSTEDSSRPVKKARPSSR
jgi:hypothetical protein